MAKQECKNCQFWKFDAELTESEELGKVGNCERFPPTYHSKDGMWPGGAGCWYFPVTFVDQTCGEWKKAK